MSNSAQFPPPFSQAPPENEEVIPRLNIGMELNRIFRDTILWVAMFFAALYGVARYNAFTYVSVEPDLAGSRAGFLDYMSALYRRMLNEHLDALGAERGLDVGVSELAEPAAVQDTKPE
jgi:hypothetical protein